MASDPLAAAPEPPSEDEYQAFVLALSESARGRALLAEHVRRSRAAEADAMLASVQRLEALVLDQSEAPAADPVTELRDMLVDIRDVQARLDITLTTQVGELAGMIEGVQQRLEKLEMPPAVDFAPTVDAAPAQQIAASDAAPTPWPEIVDAVSETPVANPAVAPVEAEATSFPDSPFTIDVEPPAEAVAEALAGFAEVEVAAEPSAEEALDAELFEGEPAEAFAAVEEPPQAEEALPAEEPAATAVEEPPAVIMEEAAAEPELAAEPAADTGLPDFDPVPEPVAEAEEKPEPESRAASLAIAALVETLAVPLPDDVPKVVVHKAGSIPTPEPFSGEDFTASVRKPAALPEVDPLAEIMALSDDERVALFT